MIRLQRQLLLRFHSILAQFVDLRRENRLWRRRRVNTIRFDGNNNPSCVLQKKRRIMCNDTRLIWLGNISENYIHHANKHAIPLWLASIFHDRNDVRSTLRHVGEISTATMRKFYGV